MRSFIDERKLAQGEDSGSEITNTYIEIELPTSDDTSIVIYIIPRSENSAFVATCWDHVFDQLVSDLDEDGLETIADTWPTLALLFHNGIKDLYKEGALIILEDLDYGDKKWFVASIAGNISFESKDGLFNGRMQETVQVVLLKSVKLFTELRDNEPNMLKHVARGFKRGVGAAIGTVVLGGIAAFLGIDPADVV